MSATRDPHRDQPLPTPGQQPVQDALIRAVQERRDYGIRKYGRPLETHNGRDALTDAWEEALDLVTYLTQMRLERGDALPAEQEPASLSPATDRAPLRTRIAEALAREDAHNWGYDHGFVHVYGGDPETDAFVDAVLSVLPAPADRAAEAEAPLSPDYEHLGCGFHWHGRDGMDIPMRDGQPVCPRCELQRVEKLLARRERKCEELRAESKRRGKVKLEYAEKNRLLERDVDRVREQLGAEILRSGQAETELRRMADETQQPEAEAPRCGAWGGCVLPPGHNMGQADIPEHHRLPFTTGTAQPTVGAQQPKEDDNPRTVCVCGHTRAEHVIVGGPFGRGRLLCDECVPDSTDNPVCKEFEAL